MRRLILLTVLVFAAALPGHTHPQQEYDGPPFGADETNSDFFLRKSDEAFHAGDYERAVLLNRARVAIDPEAVDSFGVGAWLLWSMGEVSAADWLLEYGLKRSPKQGIFYNNIGQHLFRTKRYPESRGYLEKAVKLREGVPPVAWSTLGRIYTNEGRHADAVVIFRDQTRRFPGFPAAAKNLKQAEERLAASKR